MTLVHQGDEKQLGDFEWDGFAQSLDMIRPAEKPAVLLNKKNGRVVAAKMAPQAAIDAPVSFESWLWKIATRPESFLAILVLNVCSELLAPL